ncbi:MAG TPA: hypothetical protein VK186_21570 [Candidatus Deferrimicrobium sp.]|nr:hypothetical protein [Candidatus Deferrimicrobium sp.]
MKYAKIFVLIFLYLIAPNLPGDAANLDQFQVNETVDPGNLGAKYEAYTTINYYLHLYDFEKAESSIDAYLAKDPSDPFILAEKAYLLKDVKNEYGEAVKVLKKIHKIYPGYYYSNYLMASLLYLHRDANEIPGLTLSTPPLDEALKYLEISIKNNGKFFDSLFLAGAILSDKGKPNESNRYLEKALAVKQTVEPYFYLANNYKQLKDIEKEIQTYKKILTFIPYDPKSLTEISNYLLKRGDLKGAADYLERLSLKYPEDKTISTEYLQVLFGAREVEKFLDVSDTVDISGSPLLVFARAFFLGEKERYTEAIKLLNEVKERDAKTNLLRADIYKRKKDYFDAFQTVQEIAAKDRNYLFYSLYIEVLALLDMNRRIINEFEQIKNDNTVTDKLSLSDYYNIIYAYCNLNLVGPLLENIPWIKAKIKSKEESEVLDELMGLLEPLSKEKKIDTHTLKFDINIYLIVNLYKHRGKYDEAISLLEEFIKKEMSPVPYLEICDIYLQQNKSTAAETVIKEMRQLFPGDVEVNNLYAYFLALENRELKKALTISKDTLAKDGESAAYLDTSGYILFKMGRINEAVVFLEKAYWKNPFEPEIMEHLANCYRLQKNTAKVIAIYQRAIDNNVDFKDRLMEKIKHP